jgi:ABC-type transporter Mla subunit MlaD
MFKRGRRIEQKLDALTRLVQTFYKHTMSQLDDLITAIDNETNAVAAEVAALRAQLAAAPTVTQATLDKLSSISTRLQGIAADPANPVPAPAPAPSTPTP